MTQDHDFPSVEAREAYEKAEALIEKAIAEGATGISFGLISMPNGPREHLPFLERLPKNLFLAKNLVAVSCANTRIGDFGIADFAKLENLLWLSLVGTQVTVHGLSELAKNNQSFLTPNGNIGLIFLDNSLALEDIGMKNLNELPNPEYRTREILRYLREFSIHVPSRDDTAPCYSIPPAGGITSNEASFDEARERQSEVGSDFIRKAKWLIGACANDNSIRASIIREMAEHFIDLLRKPLHELKHDQILSAVSSFDNMRYKDDHESDSARGSMGLNQDIVNLMNDIVKTHGIYLAGFPKFAAYEAKTREAASLHRNDILRDAALNMVAALKQFPGAMGIIDQQVLELDAMSSKAFEENGAFAEWLLVKRLWNIHAALGQEIHMAFTVPDDDKIAWLMAHPFVDFWAKKTDVVMAFQTASQGEEASWLSEMIFKIRVKRKKLGLATE